MEPEYNYRIKPRIELGLKQTKDGLKNRTRTKDQYKTTELKIELEL
jgi:hypothetical protein